MDTIKVLFLGDIFARVGRNALKEHLRSLIEEYKCEIVLANGENSAGGLGIDNKSANEIFASGVDYITTGNHIWNKPDIIPLLEKKPTKIIRPENFPNAPGHGYMIFECKGMKVAVVNIMGRVFMGDLVSCPFLALDALLNTVLKDIPIIIVDFHAEATSEKKAFSYYFSGRVSAVLGTHTHIQTADEQIYPEGTAYLTDLGMCGPYDSVIGVEKSIIIDRFLTGRGKKFDAAKGRAVISGVVMEITKEGKALSIERINKVYQ